jgi:DNA adenine methylase
MMQSLDAAESREVDVAMPARHDGYSSMEQWRVEEGLEVPPSATPFLRWAGGKRGLAPRIIRYFPDSYGRYVEPFLGSGAVFFKLRPGSATLSDLNPDLMCAYRVVRDSVEELISGLRRLSQDSDSYYIVRADRPHDEVGIAVRFIYLVRVAFNGIWRVNRRGEFNVPYGKRPRRDLVEAEALRLTSRALQGVTLLSGDFAEVLEMCGPGDLIYADPPYTVRHENNGFRKYNEILFSWDDQVRLASALRVALTKGARVVVSNARHPSVRELYSGFREIALDRASCVAASVDARQRVTESLFVAQATTQCS